MDETRTSKGLLSLKGSLSRFLVDETGATAIEYGLIASIIALVIISAVRRVGTNLGTKFNAIAGNLAP